MCAHVDLQASAIWILTQTDAPACSLVISLVLPSCWGDGGGLISSLSGLRGHLLCTYTANTTGSSYVGFPLCFCTRFGCKQEAVSAFCICTAPRKTWRRNVLQ